MVISGGKPLHGLGYPRVFITHYPYQRKPAPVDVVRVLTGMGAGYSGKPQPMTFPSNIDLTVCRRCRWVSEYKDLVALAPLVPDLVLNIGEGGLQWVTSEVCFIFHLMVESP